MGEDPLLDFIKFTWFSIHVIIIQPKLKRGMNGLPLSMICIVMHNDDIWARLCMIQITKSGNRNWSYLIIINDSNVDMTVWIHIDNSNILTRDSYIGNPINQLLKMCSVVDGRLDKWVVNLTMQFFH